MYRPKLAQVIIVILMKWCIERIVGRSAFALASVISTVCLSTALKPVIWAAIFATFDPMDGSR